MRYSNPTRQGSKSAAPRGFSLIELLIVVAIILIIAAIAIPNFMRARITANETAAVSNMRTIITANVVYSSTYANGYAPSLLALTDAGAASCNAAGLVDNVLAAGQKSGYSYGYTPGVAVTLVPAGCGMAGTTSYMLTATPLLVGTTGQRSFCALEGGLIRQDPSGALIGAGNCIPPLRPAIQ